MIYWCTVCVISFVVIVTTFEIQCPHPSQWKERATKECVLVSSYLCLFNPLKSSYDEKCGSEDIARKGFKYILTPNLHQRECLSDSYQPFTFTTNGSSDCIFVKSNCNDDGQVKASEGSTVLDRTCKCDYTRGYSYITHPRNICSCVPSEEDCTCYFSPCKDNNQVMVSDYTCKAKYQLHYSACPAVSSLPDSNSKENTPDLYGNTIPKTNMSAQKLLLPFIALAVLFIVIYLVWISVRPEITNYKVTPEISLIFCDDDSIDALDGDQLIIECEYRSMLSVYFTWWKEVHGNFEEILESDIIKGTKTSKLMIKPLQLHHEGRYKCVIRIINGLNSSLCNTFEDTVLDLSCFYSENKTTQVFFNQIHVSPAGEKDMDLYATCNYRYMIKRFDYDTAIHISHSIYVGPRLMRDGCDMDFAIIVIGLSKHTSYTRVSYCVKLGEDHVYACNEMDLNGDLNPSSVLWLKLNKDGYFIRINNDMTKYKKKYSSNPSLTIKTCTSDDAGKYMCEIKNKDGKHSIYVWNLNIIPQDISYDEMLEHREDKLYVKTSSINAAKENLQRKGIVLITGREGTGKSKLCFELASLFHEEEGYLPFKANLATNDITYYNESNLFWIFDQTKIENSILKQLVENKNKVVLTCRTSELSSVLKKLHTHNIDVNFINLDTALKKTEKEHILFTYMKHCNIFKTSADESNFRNPIIIRDLTIEVKLDHNSVRSIVTSEPYLGFPLSVALFCADRNLLHLGETYFTKPPKYILDDFTKLYNTAKKCTGTEKEIQMYLVLVFIYLNNTLNIAELDKNKSSFLALKAQLFKKGNCESQDLTESVTEAAHCMVNKYLTNNDGIYTFNHHCMSQALRLSCKDFEGVIIQLLLNGSLEDIITFVRSSQHASIDEFTICLKDQHKHLLCQRLLSECCSTSENQQLINIASYIYETWIKLRDIDFKNKFLSCMTPASRQSSTEGIITPFWRIVLVLDHITVNGKDSWIYQSDVSDFILLYGIIAASAFRYLTTDIKKKTFQIMLTEFNKKIQDAKFHEILCSELDQCGNTFFHYLVICNEIESRYVLDEIPESLKNANRSVLGKWNKMNFTPLHFAAFLGKCTMLKILLVKTKYTDKDRKYLLKVANIGVKAVFNSANERQINNDSKKALVERKIAATYADVNATNVLDGTHKKLGHNVHSKPDSNINVAVETKTNQFTKKLFLKDSNSEQSTRESTREENIQVSEVNDDDGEESKLHKCFKDIPFVVTGTREDFENIRKLLNRKKLKKSRISKDVDNMQEI